MANTVLDSQDVAINESMDLNVSFTPYDDDEDIFSVKKKKESSPKNGSQSSVEIRGLDSSPIKKIENESDEVFSDISDDQEKEENIIVQKQKKPTPKKVTFSSNIEKARTKPQVESGSVEGSGSRKRKRGLETPPDHHDADEEEEEEEEDKHQKKKRKISKGGDTEFQALEEKDPDETDDEIPIEQSPKLHSGSRRKRKRKKRKKRKRKRKKKPKRQLSSDSDSDIEIESSSSSSDEEIQRPRQRKFETRKSSMQKKPKKRKRKKKEQVVVERRRSKRKTRQEREESPIKTGPNKSWTREFKDIVKLSKRSPHTFGAKRTRKDIKYTFSWDPEVDNESEEIEIENVDRNAIFVNEEGDSLLFVITGNFPGKQETKLKIIRNGGRILDEKYLSRKNTSLDDTILISDKPKTTFKYLVSLIHDIPLVHHQWIDECVESGMLSFPVKQKYLLKVAENVNKYSKVVSGLDDLGDGNKKMFEGKKFVFLTPPGNDRNIWGQCVCHCGGIVLEEVVEQEGCDYLVCDNPNKDLNAITSKLSHCEVIPSAYIRICVTQKKKISLKHMDTRKIIWSLDPIEQKEGKKFYNRAQIGDETFRCGDVVEVFEDDEPSNVQFRYVVIVQMWENFNNVRRFSFRAFLSFDQLKNKVKFGNESNPVEKNELFLNVFVSDADIKTIKGKFRVFPHKCRPENGIFCTRMTNMSIVQPVEEEYEWNTENTSLQHFWFQNEAECSKQEEFFSYAVIGSMQYFINHWVRLKAVYKNEVCEIIGKIVEMMNDTKFGKALFIKVGEVDEKNVVSETTEVRRILIEQIFEITPLRFIDQENKTFDDVQLDNTPYIPKAFQKIG